MRIGDALRGFYGMFSRDDILRIGLHVEIIWDRWLFSSRGDLSRARAIYIDSVRMTGLDTVDDGMTHNVLYERNALIARNATPYALYR